MNSSISAQQAGEVPTVNDMIKKGCFQTGLARAMINNQLGNSNSYGSTNSNDLVMGLDSWMVSPSGMSWQQGQNQAYMRLKQAFDFFGGKTVHCFENTGNTTITIELIEWSPRKAMMGGYSGSNSYSAQDQGVSDILYNDPIQLTVQDYLLNYLTQQPNQVGASEPYSTEGLPRDDLNYNMLSSGVTFVDPNTGIATQAQQPVANSTTNVSAANDANGNAYPLDWNAVSASGQTKPVYNGTSSEPNCFGGVADPTFRLGRGSHRLTNGQYKHSSPVYLTIEPGSKGYYTMYAPAFSFNGSDWNVLSNNIKTTLNEQGGQATEAGEQQALPNFVPLFTKFLSIRSFSNVKAHRLWNERSDPANGTNEVTLAGGAYVHTQDEYYSFRYVPPIGIPNQYTFKNNRTDMQDEFTDDWYVGNATTGNEQIQDVDE